MKILVLGAGLIGVSTAYYLARAGHNVTVIERQKGPGLETSFANGGQISASHATPWSNPTTPWNLLKWLRRRDAPLFFRLSSDPALWRFALRFLANCRVSVSAENGRTVARLALYSRELLAELRRETDIAFDAEDRGILHVYRDNRSLERAAHIAAGFHDLGLDTETLDAGACAAVEPALEPVADELAGGIFSPGDGSGDAHLFTVGLAQACVDAGVDFRLDTRVKRIAQMSGRISGVMTDNGMLTADRYVVAMGSYSPLFLHDLGIRIPVYPVKGYSLTAPVTGSNRAPRVSLTDDESKIVVSRLGDNMRVAGMADFNRYDTDIDPARAGILMQAATRLLPEAFVPEQAHYWAGLRPLSPDGVPVIGTTGFANLIVNTGHGTLGWTLACASGRIAADLATGQESDIDVAPFSPAITGKVMGDDLIARRPPHPIMALHGGKRRFQGTDTVWHANNEGM
jgi:D-amino-acid dehydrogenase